MFGDAASDFLSHPIVVPVAAFLLIALLGWIGHNVRRILKSTERTEAHVLPHFTPPPPDEPHRPDNTLPARVGRVEEMVSDAQASFRAGDERMAKIEGSIHEVKTGQESLNDRLSAVEQRVQHVEESVDPARLLETLTATRARRRRTDPPDVDFLDDDAPET